MSLAIIGGRTELGRVLARCRATGKALINVGGQEANTLLHDGHAWQDFERRALAGVHRALRADAPFIVHASFAFVVRRPRADPLHSIAATILECERLVLSGPTPACVVRLGYLYGPGSRDLLAYRKAFRIGRPYWAGPAHARQFHLHEDDAVSALLAAAKARKPGRILYAVGGKPVPFMQFMDDFARRIGNPFPLHVPKIATRVIRLIVREEHQQQAALAMPARPPAPRVRGWKPKYADYRKGLDQVIGAWAGK
jgi:nucleoside-diphosphate-sugar epimerase